MIETAAGQYGTAKAATKGKTIIEPPSTPREPIQLNRRDAERNKDTTGKIAIQSTENAERKETSFPRRRESKQ
jgi:hypothetical protein